MQSYIHTIMHTYMHACMHQAGGGSSSCEPEAARGAHTRRPTNMSSACGLQLLVYAPLSYYCMRP